MGATLHIVQCLCDARQKQNQAMARPTCKHVYLGHLVVCFAKKHNHSHTNTYIEATHFGHYLLPFHNLGDGVLICASVKYQLVSDVFPKITWGGGNKNRNK